MMDRYTKGLCALHGEPRFAFEGSGAALAYGASPLLMSTIRNSSLLTHESIMMDRKEAIPHFAHGLVGFDSGHGSMPSASASATMAANSASSSSTVACFAMLVRRSEGIQA